MREPGCRRCGSRPRRRWSRSRSARGVLAAVLGVGWLGRVLIQVLFFEVVGLLLADPEAMLRLGVGKALLLAERRPCFGALDGVGARLRLVAAARRRAGPAVGRAPRKVRSVDAVGAHGVLDRAARPLLGARRALDARGLRLALLRLAVAALGGRRRAHGRRVVATCPCITQRRAERAEQRLAMAAGSRFRARSGPSRCSGRCRRSR